MVLEASELAAGKCAGNTTWLFSSLQPYARRQGVDMLTSNSVCELASTEDGDSP